MKKIKLSTIFAIVVYAILSVGIFACGKAEFPTIPTKFVVATIEQNERGTSLYYVYPIEKKNLNVNSTWFIDSVGKYNAGDTVCFHSYRQ